MSSPTRPRPLSPLTVDLDNAYARAGVSPTLSTEEISRRLREKHRKLQAEAKRSGGDEALTAQLSDLSALIDQIGDPRRRAAYDAAHPENELLTVQAPRRDALAGPAERAAFVSTWLLEEAAEGELVPHPRCLALWCPAEPIGELSALLKDFVDPDQNVKGSEE